MPSKLQLYCQMADVAAKEVTGTYHGWTDFLRTAARLYKYPYNEQVMIHAQRPDATACAEFDFWNQKMGRYIRRGSHGIALIDTSGDNPRLRYVFDVADTQGREHSRPVNLWTMEDTHIPAVSEMLEKNYQVTPENSLIDQMEDAASKLVEEYWQEHQQDVYDIVADSFLEGYDDLNIKAQFYKAASVSITYALMSRCGMEPERYFLHEDFLSVFDFNTPEAASVLGTAVSQINQQVLRQIEVTIRNYDREQSRQATAERTTAYERTDLHAERRLPDSQHQPQPDGGASSRQVREAQKDLPSGAPAPSVEQDDPVRNPVPTPAGDRQDGEQPAEGDATSHDAGSRGNGASEGHGPHEVGRADEHAESTGRGSDPDRADLQLNQQVSQLSLFPSEADQIAYIDTAESDISPSAFSMSIDQNIVDEMLRLGGNGEKPRMKIVAEFSKRKPDDKNAEFLQTLFRGGNGIVTEHGRYTAWYAEDGIHMALGDSARYLSSAMVIPWEEAAHRIGELLADGNYATNVEVAEAGLHERTEIAQSLWYLRQDFSDTAREQDWMLALNSAQGGGFPDETAKLAAMLADPVYRKKVTQELSAFVRSYTDHRDLLRFHYHKPNELLNRLQDLAIPRQEYHSNFAEPPAVQQFITEDEIAETLAGGSGMAGGRSRIFQFFTQNHATKEQADFLKDEYGTGGHSHAVSGASGSMEDHSSKGISLKKDGCTEIQMNWVSVAKRIAELIRKDRYLTPDEKDAHEKIQAEQDLANTESVSADVKEPTTEELLSQYKPSVIEKIRNDATYRNTCGHSDHETAVKTGKTAVQRAILDTHDDQLIHLYTENEDFRERLLQEAVEETYSQLHEQLRPISQDDITQALQTWNGNPDSKRAVVRHMREHGREKDTAAWLFAEYGSNKPFVVRPGSPEEMVLSWSKVQRGVAKLIQEDRFFTEQEQDNWEHIDPVEIKERLENGESNRFVEQVLANVKSMEEKTKLIIDALPEDRQRIIRAMETAGFEYRPLSPSGADNHVFYSVTDSYPISFQNWDEVYEWIDSAQLKDEPSLREKVQAVLHPDRQQDQKVAYEIGDAVYLEGDPYTITDIDPYHVELLPPGMIYPIYRSENREVFERLLLEDERNNHLLSNELPSVEVNGNDPGYHTETTATYPGEETHLPFDVVVETLHVDEPEPPARADSPVSIPIGGEWVEFPNAQAAQKAAHEEHKAQIRSNAKNFRITDDGLSGGGAKEKFLANIYAIKLLKELEADNRQAIPEQQEVLSRYVGWGGLADAFDPDKPAWSNEYQELKKLLTPEEYEAARASTLNAHYTSPTIIKAIYDAVGNMGFESGNILEPSCGVGNFFGMLPEEMQDSRLYGVELDPISGRIAQQLYPKAEIQITGFENTDRPDFYDLAIGNVPFGQYQVADKAYNKLGFSIHNYFAAKSLDQVRPGGIVAIVTSRYTMDAKDSTVRRHLAQKADLLGAIRLPNNAFKANAGAEVVSDILFFQKRDQPLTITPDWTKTEINDDGYPINSYFQQHPEMVLGISTEQSGPHGMEYTVKPIPNAELSDQLHDAIQNIHGAYQEAELPDLGEGEAIDTTIPADPNVKNYSYAVVDGEVYYRENSRMVKPDLNATAKERVKGMVELRDCVHKLIDQQLDGYIDDAEIHTTQVELNDLYDAYTKKYGLINSRANALAFSDDSSYYLLCSLEFLDEDKNLERKADMFTKRTIRPHEAVTSVDTASEALAVSISERACVDMEYMSELTGKTEQELFSELRGVIFMDMNRKPDGSYTYRTADDFLSGNVREKLDYYTQALDYTEGTPKYNAMLDNVEALKQAQPVDLDASEIEVRLGATWIDQDYIREFMFDLLEPPFYLRRTIDVTFSPFTAEWNIKGKSNVGYHDINSRVTYGTERVNAYKILEDTLNLRDVRVYDTVTDPDGKERRVLNSKETTLAQQKQQAIKDAFQEWIWRDPDRRQALVAKYNELYNSTRPREYDGKHITFSGMNPEIKLRDHQLNAVAHVLYGGNTLLAHQVGAGKTFEMVAAAMESKRLGLCQKSLFAVPNHLTEQWAAEFLRLYPSANILVATKKDFEPKNRKKFCARIATGNYDAIIMGHSQFEKIPVSQERQEQMLNDQIAEIEEGLQELKNSGAERFTVKSLERTKKSLEVRLKKLLDSDRKDDVVTFEQLGVDRLFVDEAHSFKNLFLYTKMRNVAGLSTSDAQKSSDMLMKCRYLDEITGGKGVVFATGTPVSNSMTELYTMMRYLQNGTLKQRGLTHFDCWASTFGETTTAIELAPEGTGYRARTRFSKFFNLPELMTLFKEIADIKTSDQLHLPTPEPIYHTEVAQPTEIQQSMVQELSERAAAVHSGAVDPSEDNMLRITGDGRKLGLDQRVVNPDLPDDPNSKVNTCIHNIVKIYEDGQDEKLTQLVFCDLSTPKATTHTRAAKAAGGNLDSPELHTLESSLEGVVADSTPFSIYDDIREKLVASGIPRDEIAFIHDANTEARKKELYGKVRNGQVRVLLGSTSKMGSGMNVQDRLVALHDLDCPWRPGDLEQRSGRIIRQGNRNKQVHIYHYVTEGTFDAYLWQTVENKQKFISQIMTSKSPVRSCDDVDETALSFAEIKALCAGDPRIKEKMDLDVDVARLKLMRASHQSQQYRLEDNILKTFPAQIEENKGYIARFQSDLATLTAHPHPKDGFAGMTVKDDALVDKDNAGAAILEAFKEVKGMEPVPIGSYRGFQMSLTLEDFGRDYVLTLKGEMTHRVKLGRDARGNLTRIDNALNTMEDRLKTVQDRLDNIYAQMETAKAELGKPFPQEQEYREKSLRLAELNAELNIDEKTPMEALAVEAVGKAKPSVLDKLKNLSGQTRSTPPRDIEREDR